MHLHRTRVRLRNAILATALASVFPVAAQQPASSTPASKPASTPDQLKEVTISSTRTEQDVLDVANTVTVIPAEKMERELANDIKDMIRFESGVSVRNQPSRFQAAGAATGRSGNDGINIRGLEGNQVLLQVDGVKLPNFFTFGAQAAGRGDYIDIEAFKAVEILRGPASTLYGSDGLAGAVSFITKDPADLLTLGKSTQAAVKMGYSSADRSFSLVPSFAARGDSVEGMFLASIRRGHETETAGSRNEPNFTRTTANPQEVKADYVLGKLVFKLAPGHQLKLMAESQHRRIDTNVLSAVRRPANDNTLAIPALAAATVLNLRANDKINRERVKADYEYVNPSNLWFQKAALNFYYQESRNRQINFEDRNTSADRTRENLYNEKLTGGGALFESNFGQGTTHRLVYGLDASVNKITGLRDGTVPTAPDVFPTKAFPDTEYRLFGAYAQDEISFGKVSLIPGARYDSYKLTPRTGDPHYVGVAPSVLSDSALSPKLGVVWKVAPLLIPFAQYSRGFRAPTPNDVNTGFTNLASGYRSISNPNLKAEKSDSIEVGLRGRDATFKYSASAYYNKYKDFIANLQLSGTFGNVADPAIFQSINLPSTVIHGFEFRGEWNFARRWSLAGSMAYTSGEATDNTGTTRPLVTIDPMKSVIALRHDAGMWGGRAVLTVVEGKKRNPNPLTTNDYSPSGFQVVDLLAHYNFGKQTSLNLGLFNLFNQKYQFWSDTRGLPNGYVHIDAYSQPGRNASISVKHQF